jgi:type IV pilus assembly protein PilN
MRLNINLASQPYELAQAYKRRMTSIIAALGAIAVLLLGYIAYQRQNTRAINQQIAQVNAQIQSLDHEEAQARVILNKPANRVIADQSDFLNQLFARKSLSWTRIFTEMEKIVPSGLHVVSMKPEYTKTNDLVLHVIVATDSRDRAVEMVRHMEKSSHLRQAQIVAETVTTNSSDQAAGGGNIQFDIAAMYVPGAADDDEATDTQDGAGKPTAATGQSSTPVNKANASPPSSNITPAGTNMGAARRGMNSSSPVPNAARNRQPGIGSDH